MNILGVGWLRQRVGQITYSPTYSAQRFLAFRSLVTYRYDRNVEVLSEAWMRLGIDKETAEHRRRLLLLCALAAMKRYDCFDEKTTSWFHAN